MHITNLILATILCLSSSVTSAPTAHKRGSDDFAAPTSYNYIASDEASEILDKRDTTNTTHVQLSDGADFGGHVWEGDLPVDDCINLNSYAHNLGSFRAEDGFECLIYQGRCDANMSYGDLYSDSTYAGHLAEHYADFIDDVVSFQCYPILPS